MSISIQLLSDSDLGVAANVLSSAFHRPGNWINNLQFNTKLQPDGYYGAYQDGVLAGMVGATIYSTFAYVGLMGVHPEFQRRGIGLALMQYLLSWLDEKKIPLTLLDASPAGQLLYQKLGFVACDPVYVFQKRSGQPILHHLIEPRFLSIKDLERINITDTQAFGANRSKLLRNLLERYPKRAFILQDGLGKVDGYLVAQESRIGPWVMQETEGAESLLQAALSLPFDGAVSVVVPGSNVKAMTLLHRYGFEVIRTNLHMMRGTSVRVDQREIIFGQTSLSLG
jgi:ribosomal protein S18 acetylase RimI-like enzyme